MFLVFIDHSIGPLRPFDTPEEDSLFLIFYSAGQASVHADRALARPFGS